VRLQLDNELVSRGQPGQYRGWLDCVGQSWRAGGAGNLWRGLSFGVAREMVFNCARIGSFDPLLAALGHPMLAGFCSGALGGCAANPIEVLKVRYQALGGLTGHQHAQFRGDGFFSALGSMIRNEGPRAAFTGIGVSTLRGVLGPGTQLPAYYQLKKACGGAGLNVDSPAVHGACSALSAGASIFFCNPADVVRTRLYNQPVDGARRYRNAVDAAAKIFRTEGPMGFYKGALTHYMRLGPHIVLVFTILERLRMLAR